MPKLHGILTCPECKQDAVKVNREHVKGEVINSGNFDPVNEGQIILDGHPATCPHCEAELFFEEKYLKRIDQKTRHL